MFTSKKVKAPSGEGAVEWPDLLGQPPTSGPQVRPHSQHTLPNIRRWLSRQDMPGSFGSVLTWDTLTLSGDGNRAG